MKKKTVKLTPTMLRSVISETLNEYDSFDFDSDVDRSFDDPADDDDAYIDDEDDDPTELTPEEAEALEEATGYPAEEFKISVVDDGEEETKYATHKTTKEEYQYAPETMTWVRADFDY